LLFFGFIVVGKPSRRSIMKGLKLYPVGTDTAKTVIYGRLKVEEPGPGYCHFSDHYPDDYFNQLTKVRNKSARQ